MKIKGYPTNFDLYANLARLEKDEASMQLSNTREELDELNHEIHALKVRIIEHESKVRGYGEANGENIILSEYQMICLNIQCLSEEANSLCDTETIVKERFDNQSKELEQKRKLLDKLLEKQASRRSEIVTSIEKKNGMDMDDLWSQVNWVKLND